MVEVDSATPVIGPHGPVSLLDVFDGRRQLIAYYFMWHTGHPAPEQCEGCTWVTTQVAELSYLHSRDITYAVFCQGPYDESLRYRDFMGWDMPWYSAQDSIDTLLVGRHIGAHGGFHLDVVAIGHLDDFLENRLLVTAFARAAAPLRRVLRAATAAH